MSDFKAALQHRPEINPRKFFVLPSGFMIFARTDEQQHEMLADRIIKESSDLKSIFEKVNEYTSAKYNQTIDPVSFLEFYGYIFGWAEEPKYLDESNPIYINCTLPLYLLDLKDKNARVIIIRSQKSTIGQRNEIEEQKNGPKNPIYSCCEILEFMKQLENKNQDKDDPDVEEEEDILQFILNEKKRLNNRSLTAPGIE